MFVKKFKYVDFDGVTREEEHMFYLNKAEIIKWMTTNGDYTLDKLVLRLTKERNGKRIMEIFDDLIHKSYGRISVDGRRFEKSEELWKEFKETEAYSQMFSELIQNGDAAAEFIAAILPSNLSEEVNRAFKENADGIPDELKPYAKKISEAAVQNFPGTSVQS